MGIEPWARPPCEGRGDLQLRLKSYGGSRVVVLLPCVAVRCTFFKSRSVSANPTIAATAAAAAASEGLAGEQIRELSRSEGKHVCAFRPRNRTATVTCAPDRVESWGGSRAAQSRALYCGEVSGGGSGRGGIVYCSQQYCTGGNAPA